MSVVEFPPIYCINLKTSQGRRQRMERRFKYHGVSEAVTFIEAIPRTSPLIDHYTQRLEPPLYTDEKWRGEIACFISHLKAIKQFVTDGEKYALICEDDILPCNNFLERYVDVIRNADASTPLISFGYMLEKNEGLIWSGVKPELHNLLTLTRHVWGAQMYLISKEYAMKSLTIYDRPLIEVSSPLLTSEVIIQESEGFLVYPPIVIEDCIDSDRAPSDLPYHKKHFESWGVEKYNLSEN